MPSSQTRVLFLTQYFPPETGAPQARIYETAMSLRTQGFDVEVLTALPNYPTGHIYSGYKRKLSIVETIDGLRVVRTVIYPSISTSFAPRLMSYLSFVLSSLILGTLRVHRPDVIVCESPPLFLGLTAIALKLVYRCRLVFNVSDLWPDSAVNMGLDPNGIGIRFARVLERLCYRVSAVATGQSLGIVRTVASRSPTGRAVLISNGADTEVFKPGLVDTQFRDSLRLDGTVTVGYAGLLGMAQGVGVVLDVAERTREESDLRFVLVGDGPERARLEDDIRLRRLDNVVIAGHFPKERMPAIVGCFDITLVPLRYHLPGALPSKIYEAMATGVPIVLCATGDAQDLIRSSGAGVICDYDQPDEIARELVRLARDPSERSRLGRNGRDYVVRHHDRRTISQKMGGVIDCVARGAWAELDELAQDDSHA